MTVFVDTSVLFAAARPSDGAHGRSVGLLQSLADESAITTDHVMVETSNLLLKWEGAGAGRRWWLGIFETPMRIEVVSAVDLERARAVALGWPDQEFSLTDCSSFAVMERVGCHRVASFDDDFAIYRYGLDRSKVFDVLR